jgi:hypothetical protein
MTKHDDGGPAFPCDNITRRDEKGKFFGAEVSISGMSLRDHFAGLALQSLSAAVQDESITTLEDRAEDTARACYTIADAMLKARKGST